MGINLRRLAKNLRSFAKRCKNIKYTESMLITFLLTGLFGQKDMLANETKTVDLLSDNTSEEMIVSDVSTQGSIFELGISKNQTVNDNLLVSQATRKSSVSDNSIQAQRKAISTSISDIKQSFKQAKAENNKLLKSANLELIQLMEQGDQVVKSPWSSWQFGANYFYEDWNGTYKGRGDKKEKYPYEGIFVRSANPFERYTSPLSSKYGELSVSTNPFSASSNNRQGLGSGYGIASTRPVQEPLASINVEASIRPKTVAIEIPDLGIKAPTLNAINVPNLLPPAIDVPEPYVPQKQVSIVEPNASPFTGFFFDANRQSIGALGGAGTTMSTPVVIYSGLAYNGGNFGQGAANTGYVLSGNHVNVSASEATDILGTVPQLGMTVGRTTNALYRTGSTNGNALSLSNMTFHLRGYYDGTDSGQNASATALKDSWTDIGRGAAGGADPNRGATRGTIGLHTLLNVDVANTNVNLYGRAGFLTSETWRSGTVTMSNTTVNVYNDQNSVYFIMPSAYGTIARYLTEGGTHDNFYIGGLKGSTDVNLYGSGNNVYLSIGISGARHIENDGAINSDGASNIVYSGMSYVPNWSNTYYQTRGGTINRTTQNGYSSNIMQSVIKLGTNSGSVNLYGDENVGLFFGSKMGGAEPKSWETTHRDYENMANYIRRASYIGIYQGEIEANIKIGENTSSTGAVQTAGNISGNDANLVEGAVGVFVQSGQRAGISPIRDLGVPVNATIGVGGPAGVYQNISSIEDDTIKPLQLGNINITFGNKSKDGFMMISRLGSHLEVAKPGTSSTYISGLATSLTDGISGANTSSADASTGTVIAYAEGTWDQSVHQLGSNASYLAANNNAAAGSTAATLNGQGSLIDIYVPVVLASKNGIAYMGDNKGIVNAKGTKTTAVNDSSIIGYARNQGVVNIDGDVEAIDKNVTDNKLKYENIAGLAVLDKQALPTATQGGTVNIAGNVNVYGMGALASGTGSIVNLNGTNNVIKTGESGGLAAIKGGRVNFAGGKITHSENESGDHDSSAPMYAESGSIINFTGATTIDISHGILMPGLASDYAAASGTSAKYNGMQNVTVNLTGDNVILSTNSGATTNWTGGTAGSSGVAQDMKLAALNTNNRTYKIYYTNGIFNLNTNLNLDDTTDEFNKSLGLSNEVFTIGSGFTVSSTQGKGLSMGSNNSATSNSTNAYINQGTVNITGGSLAAGSGIALNMSYGTVDNQNIINVDNGIGAYAINGSRLINNTTGKINITNGGVGMAAFSSALTGLQTYGTDDKISKGTLSGTDKVFEIDNKGTLTVAGSQSIGLYGETNDPTSSGLLSATNGTITNTGKIEMTGDSAVGILSKRATVNIGGTGSSDIIVGTNGIGVYAEQTPINITSNTGIEVKDKGVGIFVKNDGSSVSGSTLEIKYTGSANESAAGIFYEGGTGVNHTNVVNINMVNNGSDKGIVGIFANNDGTITNNATITDSSGKGYGIYSEGANVINNGTLVIGDGGKGILSTKGDITLSNGSTITLGANEAIGVYINGTNQTVNANAGANISIGDKSYGFINEGTGNTINSNITSQTVGNDTVYIYSKDTTGSVNNYTALTSTGSLNYGLYSAGTVINDADINYASGIGNVGIYSTYGGTATNNTGRTITVGASNSDPTENQYAIGMAAGFTPSGSITGTPYTGNIINKGIINVNGEYSIGMYGTEAGTTVVNDGNINLSASNTTGIYLDNGAYGINNGIIQTVGSGLKNVVGVMIKNGATFENNGSVILDAENAIGLITKGNAAGANPGIIKNYGTLAITGVGSQETQENQGAQDIGKSMGGVAINTPAGASVGTITVNGNPVVPELVSTTGEEYKEMELSTIGLYIDTSSKRFTNPVQGLSALSQLTSADLIIGNEATENTNSKYLQVDQAILKPYNEMIINNPQIEKWDIYSGSLTWMASVAQNQFDGTIENAYMAKIPYTNWAGNEATPTDSRDTYNFLDGLEQRYGVDWYTDRGAREKELFNKLNSIGNNEEILLYQAIDEMMGHQYGNVQQRTVEISNKLTKEFDYLKDDWRNPSKQNNKIKTFGMRSQYKTDTAGIIDYNSKSYGVAYVHEDETIKLGNSTGWYAGYIFNQNDFKDIGKSKEKTNMIKAGVFKSTAFDDNGSLKWTISGDGYVGQNDMHRKYLVVDEIFNAKSTYYTYGVNVKNEISKDFRTSERTKVKLFGALDLGYGRFSTIKEDKGEVRLEVKSNDYYSIKPELGAEFRYEQPFAQKANFVASLGLGYETELGEVNDVNNKGRVRYTTADWFGIRGEKENRRGNGKVDLKLGIDNTRFGVTLNAGYDTNGEKFRGGIGFRAIY